MRYDDFEFVSYRFNDIAACAKENYGVNLSICHQDGLEIQEKLTAPSVVKFAGNYRSIAANVAFEILIVSYLRSRGVELQLAQQAAIRFVYGAKREHLNGWKSEQKVARDNCYNFEQYQTLLVVSNTTRKTAVIPANLRVTAYDLAIAVSNGGEIPPDVQYFNMSQLLNTFMKQLGLNPQPKRKRKNLPAVENAVSRQHAKAI